MALTEDRIERSCTAINHQIFNLLRSPAFLAWDKRPELQPGKDGHPGDLIVFNNSYLFRDSKIAKSRKYLCVTVDRDGEPAVLEPLKTRFNADLTRIPSEAVSQQQMTPIAEAVEKELASLGSILFSLAGRIGEDEPASVDVKTGSQKLSTMRFVPDQAELAVVTEDEMALSRLDNVDAAWQAVSAALKEQGIAQPTGFVDTFKRAFANLRETAGRIVDITDVTGGAKSILSEIIEGLERQIDAYNEALAKHLADPADTEVHNEVMRIAYNYSEGASELISLVMGVSDIKPIILWLTVSAQANLAYQFRQLPLAGKEKPSIADYRSEVASARNSAFHDLFAFGRPFRVPLRSDAFSSAELRLFRAHGRTEPALDYADRALVGMLERFTRTDATQAPVGFWEQNVAVMTATRDVAVALRDGLLALA
jgi:hypothetical protein